MNTLRKTGCAITCLFLHGLVLQPGIYAQEKDAQEKAPDKTREFATNPEYRQAMLSNAVIYAIENDDSGALLEPLIKAGFEPNLPLTPDDRVGVGYEGNFALHVACRSENAAAVRVLMANKADPMIRNQYQQLAIHCSEKAECLKLLERKEPAREESAFLELFYQCPFPMGFLDFSKSPALEKLRGKLPATMDIRDISRLKKKAPGEDIEISVDSKTGEEGGLITIEWNPREGGNAFDFKAGWYGGPLAGKYYEGEIVRWHGFWKVKLTKVTES